MKILRIRDGLLGTQGLGDSIKTITVGDTSSDGKADEVRVPVSDTEVVDDRILTRRDRQVNRHRRAVPATQVIARHLLVGVHLTFSDDVEGVFAGRANRHVAGLQLPHQGVPLEDLLDDLPFDRDRVVKRIMSICEEFILSFLTISPSSVQFTVAGLCYAVCWGLRGSSENRWKWVKVYLTANLGRGISPSLYTNFSPPWNFIPCA